MTQGQKRSRDPTSQLRPTKRRKHSMSSDVSQVSETVTLASGNDEAKTVNTKKINGSNASAHREQPVATEGKKELSKHFRFGSEEPQDEPTEPENIDLIQDDEADSDDEAPEDVSASAALKSARGAASAAVEAADRQRLRLKEQRQGKDARRKAQAKKSSKKKSTKIVETQPDLESDEDEPDLLPKELLEHEFERAPTPPPQSDTPGTTSKMKRKKVLLDQPPQEMQAGSVKVRVLERTNKFLAPKAVQRSKDRREHWLQGRISGKGTRAFERRPMNAGFV